MKVGTKSVLFGAHCWFIHPFFVALAWTRLFGFPRDWRLWIAFFVHDLGYLGKPNMDGEEGELHPIWAAVWMHRHIDHSERDICKTCMEGRSTSCWKRNGWAEFALLHSRFLSKRLLRRPSQLCIADKLAVALEPWWLYLPRVILSGEIKEYMELAGGKPGSKYNGEPFISEHQIDRRTPRQWHADMTGYMKNWVETHKDGREDTWTPSASNA